MNRNYKKTMFFACFLSMFVASSIVAQDAWQLSPPREMPYVLVEGKIEAQVSLENDPIPPLKTIQLPKINLTSGENGERQTYLTLGKKAPWPGVLLNPPAVAFIVSEYEGLTQRAEVAIKKQRDSDWTRMNFEVNKLKLRLVSQAKTNDVIVKGLRQDNARLAKIHKDFVDDAQGGFWDNGFGEVIKYGLIIVGTAAVGIVVGSVAAAN